MGSKIFLVLGLLVAMVLLISIEVEARDMAETSTNRKENAEEATETNGFDDAKDAYGTSPLPPAYGTSPPGGTYASSPGGAYGSLAGGRYGGYCRYGCCRFRFFGYPCICCSYAGEAAEVNTKAKPHN